MSDFFNWYIMPAEAAIYTAKVEDAIDSYLNSKFILI